MSQIRRLPLNLELLQPPHIGRSSHLYWDSTLLFFPFPSLLKNLVIRDELVSKLPPAQFQFTTLDQGRRLLSQVQDHACIAFTENGSTIATRLEWHNLYNLCGFSVRRS